MSADNWAICPNCARIAEEKREKAIEKAQAAYGKVTAEKFMAGIAAAEALPDKPEESLREDYCLGTRIDGEFYVSYACSCRECGFEYQFDISKDLLDDAS